MAELTLGHVAQMAMDLFYQDFKAEDDFFGLDEFKFGCRAVFAKLMDNEADRARLIAKQETGFFTIELSYDWLIQETVKFEKKGYRWEAKLKQQPYSFPFDKMGYTVQHINGECRYVRIAPDEEWKLKHLPQNSFSHFYILKDKIIAFNVCSKEEAEVFYAPALINDDDIVPVGKHWDIVTNVVSVMKNIANGVVVDNTGDQNKNKLIQTEINAKV